MDVDVFVILVGLVDEVRFVDEVCVAVVVELYIVEICIVEVEEVLLEVERARECVDEMLDEEMFDV